MRIVAYRWQGVARGIWPEGDATDHGTASGAAPRDKGVNESLGGCQKDTFTVAIGFEVLIRKWPAIQAYRADSGDTQVKKAAGH